MNDDTHALLARLTEAEALKQGVIDAALDAVITADRDCRVTGWNAAAARTAWAGAASDPARRRRSTLRSRASSSRNSKGLPM